MQSHAQRNWSQLADGPQVVPKRRISADLLASYHLRHVRVLIEGKGRTGDSIIAGVLRVGMEVQVGDVGGDVLDVGCIGRHQAANVAPCRASRTQ